MASRTLLVALLTATAHAYSIARVSKPAEPVKGFACIPVPVERLVAPGQRATMHIYDTSSLEVLRHAQTHANGTYGQVVIDEEAMKERRFALKEYGTRVKVLSMTPSTHTDKFGGSSVSYMCQVIGVGVVEPTAVLAKMPFMTVDCEDDDALLAPAKDLQTLASPDAAQALYNAAELCESLDEVVSFKGELTRATEKGISSGAEGGEASTWSLKACVDEVLAQRGYDAETTSEASRLTLSALAATVHLPGAKRFEAMSMAQQGKAAELVEEVAKALDEEGRSRLAKKALSGLGESDES